MGTALDQAISPSFGDVAGNVAIGTGNQQFNLHIGSIGSLEGGRLHVLGPNQVVVPRLRAFPVDLRPRRNPAFFGRVGESHRLKQQLGRRSTVELYAGDGWGKSSLLRHAAFAEFDNVDEGVVYLSLAGRQPNDVRQLLFDSFFECEIPYKPDDAELRRLLGPRRGLILLDDVELDRNQLEQVLDTVRDSAVVVASSRAVLVGEDAIRLEGLPTPYARKLLEDRLCRKLSDDEVAQAKRLHRIVGGQPLRLVQVATTVRELRMTLCELSAVSSIPELDEFISKGLGGLEEEDRKQVEALAALRGVRLKASQLAAITGVADNRDRLRALAYDGFLAEHRSAERDEEPRYSVRPNLHKFAQAAAGTTVIMAAIEFGRDWLVDNVNNVDSLCQESEFLHSLLQSAAELENWQVVVEMGRVLEPVLAVSKQWDRWASTLDACLDAATSLQDPQLHGWVMHELGTRALCLGEPELAAEILREALSIREQIQGCPGIDATKANLELTGFNCVVVPPPEPAPVKPIAGGAVTGGSWLTTLGIIAAGCGATLLAVGGWLIFPFLWPVVRLAADVILSPPTQQRVFRLNVAEHEVVGGAGTIHATAGTDRVAPESGLQVKLESNQPFVFFEKAGVRQNSLVTHIKAGQRTASFVLQTDIVDRSSEVELTLHQSYGAEPVRESVRVVPLTQLDRLELLPNHLSGGGITRGRIWLSTALNRPTTVRLIGEPPLTMPSSLTVPANEQSADFEVSVPESEKSRSFSVRADFGDISRSATLSIGAALKVPRLVGLSVGETRTLLSRSGLKMSSDRSLRDTERVTGQTPSPHSATFTSLIEPGRAIQVEAAPVVPKVTGMQVREAASVLRRDGLRDSDTVGAPAAAIVAQQHPSAGTVVKIESLVRLQVKIQVPDVTRLAISDAMGELRERKLAGQVSSEARRLMTTKQSTLSSARVVKQVPGAGELVALGHTVELDVGVEVPDLKDLASDAAEHQLGELGLRGQPTQGKRRAVDAGSRLRGRTLVVSQQPPAGQMVLLPSTVNYVVARYSVDVRVPNLIGEPTGGASRKLKELRLVPMDQGVATVQTRDRRLQGQTIVVEQSPNPGVAVEEGESVTFRSSRYLLARVRVPQLAGDSPEAAAQKLRDSGLVPKYSGVRETITVSDRRLHGQTQVRGQTPAANQTVEYGGTVEFWTARLVAPVVVPNVVKLTAPEAGQRLASVGLISQRTGQRTERTRLRNLHGQVYVEQQDPRAGQLVDPNSPVRMSIVAYDARVQVPNLVGMPSETAALTLQQLALRGNFVGKISQSTFDPRQVGIRVFDQEVPAGTHLLVGELVRMRLAQYTLYVRVPNIVGQEVHTAKKILASRGLLAQGKQVTLPTPKLFPGPVSRSRWNSSHDRGDTVWQGESTVALRTIPTDLPIILAQVRSNSFQSPLPRQAPIAPTIQGWQPPPAKVVSQQPAPGTSVPVGSVVSFTFIVNWAMQPPLLKSLKPPQAQLTPVPAQPNFKFYPVPVLR